MKTIAEQLPGEHGDLADAAGRLSADYWSVSQGLRLLGDVRVLFIVSPEAEPAAAAPVDKPTK